MELKNVLVLMATGAVLASACRRDKDRVGAATTTSAAIETMTTNAALERLVEARCNHEQLCRETGMLGASSPTACADDVRTALGDVIATECTQGVAPARVDACASALRDAPCGGSLVAKLVPEPCRSAELCVLGALAR